MKILVSFYCNLKNGAEGANEVVAFLNSKCESIEFVLSPVFVSLNKFDHEPGGIDEIKNQLSDVINDYDIAMVFSDGYHYYGSNKFRSDEEKCAVACFGLRDLRYGDSLPIENAIVYLITVSYTHLTLPTIYSV